MVDQVTLANFSKWAYKSRQEILSNVSNAVFYHDSKTDAQAFSVSDDSFGFCIVAFRGTESMRDVRIDLSIWPIEIDGYRVHRGFYSQWAALKPSLMQLMQKCPKKVYVTGHSLGGAVANLAALDMAREFPTKQVMVVTFGSPRVGNLDFVREYDKHVFQSVRVVRKSDPIPLVPPLPFYKHPECGCKRYDDNDMVIPPDRWEGVFSRWGLTFLNMMGSVFGLTKRPSKHHSMDAYMKASERHKTFASM